MRLASPEFLLLLLLFPAAYFGRSWWLRRQGRPATPTVFFANFGALTATPTGFRTRFSFLPSTLRALALVALVVALSRPQTEDWEDLVGKGLDIMFCLDMSGSMNAVDMDFEEIGGFHTKGDEPPNRFEVARQTLKSFVANRKGDRVGLVVFSSEAYLKFPLTLDYETAIAQLDALELDSRERRRNRPGCTNNCTIKGDATAIGDALSKAYKRLEKSDGKGKVIVLVTDGNNNSGNLEPMDVADYIGDQPDATRPRLYTFLLGSGAKTKTPTMYRTRSGDIRLARNLGFLDYASTEDKVDKERIRQLAEAARGEFRVTYNDEEFRESFENLERGEHAERKVARHQDLFPMILLAALILLTLEYLLSVTVLRRYP